MNSTILIILVCLNGSKTMVLAVRFCFVFKLNEELEFCAAKL